MSNPNFIPDPTTCSTNCKLFHEINRISLSAIPRWRNCHVGLPTIQGCGNCHVGYLEISMPANLISISPPLVTNPLPTPRLTAIRKTESHFNQQEEKFLPRQRSTTNGFNFCCYGLLAFNYSKPKAAFKLEYIFQSFAHEAFKGDIGIKIWNRVWSEGFVEGEGGYRFNSGGFDSVNDDSGGGWSRGTRDLTVAKELVA